MSEDKKLIPSKRFSLKYRGIKCLNCKHPLDVSDKYCPNCSQLNSTKKVSFRDIFDEFFSSFISYDSKLHKTLVAMFTKPGKITREYIEGKRVSYTNPFRFLLSVAIIYFLMFSYTNNIRDLDDSMGANIHDASFNVTDSDNIVTWSTSNPEERELINQVLDSIQIDSIEAKKHNIDSLHLSSPKIYFKRLDTMSYWERRVYKVDFFAMAIPKKKVFTYKNALDSLKIPDTRENKLTFGISKSILKTMQQPGTYLNNTISKLPFVIFFFLPVFAIFIWLVYSKKKYSYMDHLIFSFHTITMLIILFIISFIIDEIFNISTTFIFLILFTLYLLRAMYVFYRQGKLKTFVKFMFLNTIFFTLATLTLLLFFLGGVFLY